MNVDAREIELIVTRVLEQLQNASAAARPEANAETKLFSLLAEKPTNALSLDGRGLGEGVSRRQETLAPSPPTPLPRGERGEFDPNVKSLNEAVLTHEVLSKQINGATQIRIGQRAILTPSAREFIKSRGITCVREQATQSSPTSTYIRGAGKWCRRLPARPRPVTRPICALIC